MTASDPDPGDDPEPESVLRSIVRSRGGDRFVRDGVARDGLLAVGVAVSAVGVMAAYHRSWGVAIVRSEFGSPWVETGLLLAPLLALVVVQAARSPDLSRPRRGCALGETAGVVLGVVGLGPGVACQFGGEFGSGPDCLASFSPSVPVLAVGLALASIAAFLDLRRR